MALPQISVKVPLGKKKKKKAECLMARFRGGKVESWVGNSDGKSKENMCSVAGIPTPLETGRAVLVPHETLSLVLKMYLTDPSKI